MTDQKNNIKNKKKKQCCFQIEDLCIALFWNGRVRTPHPPGWGEVRRSGVFPGCLRGVLWREALLLCVRVQRLHLKRGWHGLKTKTLKSWMWDGRKCFLFYRNHFPNPDDTGTWRYRDVICMKLWLKCFKEFISQSGWWNGFFLFSFPDACFCLLFSLQATDRL